jgi:hypothetical protein
MDKSCELIKSKFLPSLFLLLESSYFKFAQQEREQKEGGIDAVTSKAGYVVRSHVAFDLFFTLLPNILACVRRGDCIAEAHGWSLGGTGRSDMFSLILLSPHLLADNHFR